MRLQPCSHRGFRVCEEWDGATCVREVQNVWEGAQKAQVWGEMQMELLSQTENLEVSLDSAVEAHHPSYATELDGTLV